MLICQLISRLKNNEEPAFDELVLTFAARLMTVAKVYTHNSADAKDILQDAFIIIFQKIGSFQGSEEKLFYGWMKRIVINLALAKNKKSTRRQESELDLIVEDIGIDAEVLSMLNQKDIMDLIFELPNGYREVFALFVIEGYSHKEIGNKLDIKESTSRSQFTRAKRVLRAKITSQFKQAI